MASPVAMGGGAAGQMVRALDPTAAPTASTEEEAVSAADTFLKESGEVQLEWSPRDDDAGRGGTAEGKR